MESNKFFQVGDIVVVRKITKTTLSKKEIIGQTGEIFKADSDGTSLIKFDNKFDWMHGIARGFDCQLWWLDNEEIEKV